MTKVMNFEIESGNTSLMAKIRMHSLQTHAVQKSWRSIKREFAPVMKVEFYHLDNLTIVYLL